MKFNLKINRRLLIYLYFGNPNKLLRNYLAFCLKRASNLSISQKIMYLGLAPAEHIWEQMCLVLVLAFVTGPYVKKHQHERCGFYS